MKRIATITTHAALNYGAVLQAYALSKYINDQGVCCEVLNYVPAHVKSSYRIVSKPKNRHGILLSGFQLLNYSARSIRKQRFDEFKQAYLPLSGGRISDHSTLIQTANRYDTVVFGSDQIWNPVLHDFDEAYFLSFPEVTVPKVSYAASFGQDTIPERIMPELKSRLAGFSNFACREYSAQKIIRELCGKDSALVLDPVFLLPPSEWAKLSAPVDCEKPYTLLYFLSNPGQSPYAAKRHAAQTGSHLLSIGFSPRDPKYRIHCDYSLGPREFLGAIASAETILTNSFHCTAFAILMQKNFYTRISDSAGSRNDRIITLLRELGLEDRLYFDKDADNLDFSKSIDYSSVQERLAEKIARSTEYLQTILK